MACIIYGVRDENEKQVNLLENEQWDQGLRLTALNWRRQINNAHVCSVIQLN